MSGWDEEGGGTFGRRKEEKVEFAIQDEDDLLRFGPPQMSHRLLHQMTVNT